MWTVAAKTQGLWAPFAFILHSKHDIWPQPHCVHVKYLLFKKIN